MYDGVIDDINRCVELGVPKRVPVFALSEEFDVKWYGKYTYEETCQDADKLAETWIAAVEEFDYDWAWLQIDDCIEFEVLGVGCYGEGNILRATREYLPAEWDTLKKLTMPDPNKDGRMPAKLHALRKLRGHFGDKVCIVGSNAAPFSSTCLLYGLQETMMLIYTDPKLLHATNDFFVELQKMWGIAQFEAGAHATWLGDANAMSHLISVKQYEEFAFESCKKVIDAYHKTGNLTFLHNSEESIPHIELETRLGASCISVGPGIDIARAKEVVKGKTCLMGNLDPVNILMNGTPEQVARETERIITAGKTGGGYMFDTGEMNPRGVPEENMRTMIQTAKKFARY